MHAVTPLFGWHMTTTPVTPWVEWALRGLLTGMLAFAVAYLRDSSKELQSMNISLVRMEAENRRVADRLAEISTEFTTRFEGLAGRVQTLERNGRLEHPK